MSCVDESWASSWGDRQPQEENSEPGPEIRDHDIFEGLKVPLKVR